MNTRAPSTVKRQNSVAVDPKNPENTNTEDIVSDQLAKLKEENAKLRTKLKREEESRKHWQETCKKKDEEVAEIIKEKEALEKTIEAEKGNAKKYHAQLLSKSERLKYLEKKDGKNAVPANEELPKSTSKNVNTGGGGGSLLNTLTNENNKAFLQDLIGNNQQKQMSTTFQSALKKSDSISPQAKKVRFHEEKLESYINDEDEHNETSS